jgi:hypothetical protein
LCVNLALAQNTPLACQVDAAAGLSWENGQWKTTRFIENKFILVLKGNTLTKESVIKAVHSNIDNPDVFVDQTGCRWIANAKNFGGSHA